MTVQPKYRASFAEHASLSSIQRELTQAHRKAAAAEREVKWFEDLLARRTAQIEAGTWPVNPTPKETK